MSCCPWWNGDVPVFGSSSGDSDDGGTEATS